MRQHLTAALAQANVAPPRPAAIASSLPSLLIPMALGLLHTQLEKHCRNSSQIKTLQGYPSAIPFAMKSKMLARPARPPLAWPLVTFPVSPQITPSGSSSSVRLTFLLFLKRPQDIPASGLGASLSPRFYVALFIMSLRSLFRCYLQRKAFPGTFSDVPPLRIIVLCSALFLTLTPT